MMVNNEERVYLPHNAILTIGGSQYKNFTPKDSGGSCLVYDAIRMPSDYETRIGMPPVHAIIKEFYPLQQSADIFRHDMELHVLPQTQEAYYSARRNFERAAVKQVEFYGEGSNHSFAPTRIGVANNTVYTVVDAAQGTTLNKVGNVLSIQGVAEVMVSLREAVQELHERGLLYLDIKPANVFLFQNNGLLSHRVALFDFDTVRSIEDIENGKEEIPCTKAWAAREQIKQIRDHDDKDKISFATDVYALSAMLFWAYTGKCIDANMREDIEMGDFSILNEVQALRDNPPLMQYVEQEFRATLQPLPSQRAIKTVRELLSYERTNK